MRTIYHCPLRRRQSSAERALFGRDEMRGLQCWITFANLGLSLRLAYICRAIWALEIPELDCELVRFSAGFQRRHVGFVAAVFGGAEIADGASILEKNGAAYRI
jgi:hypothetical protein